MRECLGYQPGLKEKLAYLIGGIGKDLIYWLITAYFMLFLSLGGKCSPGFILTLFIAGRIFDALNDPIMGLIADFTRTRFGKFKPWLALGTVLSMFCTIALFYDPGLNGSAYQCYAAFVYIMWTLAYTMMDIPYWSLLPGFGVRPQLREQMASAARFGTLLGAQIIVWAGSFLLQRARELYIMPDFFSLALYAALLFAVMEFILLLFVKDRTPQLPRGHFSLKKCVRLISKNNELLIIIVLTLLQQTAVGLFNAVLFTFIAANHGAVEYALTPALIAGGIAQALAVAALPGFIRLCGRKVMFVISAGFMAAGYLLLCMMDLSGGPGPWLLGAACVLCAAGTAVSSVLTTIMLADSIDYGEFKLGLRAEGLLFSAQTMTAKLGLALAYLFSGLTAAFTGLLPLQLRAHSAPQISMHLSLIAAAVIALSMMILYLRSYRLHGVFFKTMLDTLERLRIGDLKQEPEVFGQEQTAIPDPSLVLVRYALDQSCIIKYEEQQNFNEVIRDLTQKIALMHCVDDPRVLEQAVLQRHQESSCAIAEGIAIAHARGEFMHRSAMGLAVMPKPLPELTCPDGTQCDLIFIIASPDDGRSHLTLLGRLSLMLNVPGFAAKLRQAGSSQEIYDRLLQCSLKIACSKH
ncbi:MAG: MFS transporter [Proteobacteria bacterium]|uniref:MFS transporter n=1 Tax=Candidatus Avisuccinivibrio stercorigallinarum TaxID=2840704 RepID=A0A9D9GT73_9GAMM|nr:MFS transporter [Candidatus Avisuccinivibrio stercorigallinarum]